MKKSYTKIFYLSVLFATSAVAQVGINTTSPETTFDVVGKPTDVTVADGITPPRLSGDQLKAKDAKYLVAQTGAIVYVTQAVATPSVKTANVTSSGHYIFNGSVWEKLTTDNSTKNIYTADGVLIANRTVSQADKTLAFTSTATSGTSHFTVDGTTLNVDAVNDRVGIGVANPAAKLEIKAAVNTVAAKIGDAATATNNITISPFSNTSAPYDVLTTKAGIEIGLPPSSNLVFKNNGNDSQDGVHFLDRNNNYKLSVNDGVSIGAPQVSNSSAILDIQSNNKGILIPRVALTGSNDTSTISAPAKGLLVFNTADAQLGTANQLLKDSFYYFNGTKWSKMVNVEELSDVVGALKIPKLAAYLFKTQQQILTDFTGGINVVDFPTSGVFENFGDSLERVVGSTSEFKVLKSGAFTFTGFANWLINNSIPGSPQVPVAGEETYWSVAIQKKSNGAVQWGNANDLAVGMRCVYSDFTTDLTQPCNFSGAISLNVGDEIRMVVIKKNGLARVTTSASLERSNALGVPYSAGFSILFIPQ